MYVRMDINTVPIPIIKKINAVTIAGASNVSTKMNASAVKIPPKACPLATAVIYSEGKSPAIPKRAPDITAEQTVREFLVIV